MITNKSSVDIVIFYFSGTGNEHVHPKLSPGCSILKLKPAKPSFLPASFNNVIIIDREFLSRQSACCNQTGQTV